MPSYLYLYLYLLCLFTSYYGSRLTMVLYLLSQAEANANAKRVSATDNPYLAQIAQARAATIDGSLSSHGRTRPGRTPV